MRTSWEVGDQMASHLLVVAWHNVEGTWCYPSRPGAGVSGFARQLDRLKRVATVVPLAAALSALSAGKPLPPRAVALTFDDGYRDNLELAVPLLERLGLPCTFFLVPGLLSREVRPWWEVLAWGFARASSPSIPWECSLLPTEGRRGRRSFLAVAERLKASNRMTRDRRVGELLELLKPAGTPDEDRLFLDWDGARELVRRGFSVGSHSMYHAILSQEAPGDQLRDLVISRRQLEAELDVPIRLLAYPNGTRADYDAATVAAAEQAGYWHAVGAHTGLNARATPLYAHSRFVLEPQRSFSEILVRRVVSSVGRGRVRRLPQ
jgi:peptidoglycan/xylan/chitin deacetylase (PgdA/CDA1 family)